MLDWLNNTRNIALTVTALLAAGSGLVGINSHFDNRYAQAAEVDKKIEKVETRLSMAELRQLARAAQEDVFFYRDQARKYPTDQDVKDKLKEAQDTLADLKAQIRELEKK
jgi:hypothetical protein